MNETTDSIKGDVKTKKAFYCLKKLLPAFLYMLTADHQIRPGQCESYYSGHVGDIFFKDYLSLVEADYAVRNMAEDLPRSELDSRLKVIKELSDNEKILLQDVINGWYKDKDILRLSYQDLDAYKHGEIDFNSLRSKLIKVNYV